MTDILWVIHSFAVIWLHTKLTDCQESTNTLKVEIQIQIRIKIQSQLARKAAPPSEYITPHLQSGGHMHLYFSHLHICLFLYLYLYVLTPPYFFVFFLSFLFLLYSVKLELCTLYSVQPRIILDFAIVWFLTFPPHTCVYAYFWETLTTQWKTSYLSYTWASFAVVSFNTEEKFWGAIDVQYVDFVLFLLQFYVQPSISGNALKLKGEDQGNN